MSYTMSTYKQYLNKVADDFTSVIEKVAGVSKLNTEYFGWENRRYSSPVFRLAHVERYSDSKVEVLHITTFPHKWSPEPIFGFDIITTMDKPVGAYMDFTPVLKNYDFDYGQGWTTKKEVPEWATVFSEQFLIVTPGSNEELFRFCDMALMKYSGYLCNILDARSRDNEQYVTEIQNHYCEVQASNPRTFNTLKTKIGPTRAKYFIEEVLFPKIK